MHPNDAYKSANEAYTNEARQEAIDAGAELITTRGAKLLFDKNPDTIRSARARDKISAPFEMKITEKRAPLYSLRSCVEAWGRPDPERLERMRNDAYPLWVANGGGNGGVLWAVLHDGPVVQLAAAAEGA